MKTLYKVIIMIAIFIATLAIFTISKAATVKVTGETLNVRESASTSANIIAMLSEGVECELLGEEGDFYKIQYKNYTGYISKQYAEVVGDSSTNSNGNADSSNSGDNANNSNDNQNTNNEQNNTNENIDNNTTIADNSTNTTANNNGTDMTNSSENNNTSNEKTLSKNTDIRILPLIYASVLENTKSDITVLVITETNGWSYIQTDEINGWVRTDKLTTGITKTTESTENRSNNSDTTNGEKNDTADEENNSDVTEKTGYINEEYVNVRSGPSTGDKVIKVLVLNSEVTITGEEGTWYKIKSGEDTGYVSKEFVSDTKRETVSRSAKARETDATTSNENNTKKEETSTEKTETKTTSVSNTSSSKGTDIVAYAKQYLGCPYVYGASGSNSFDCSGFTMYVYKHFGVSLPHGATSQSKYGTKVSKNNLQPGDIVFLTDYETGSGIGHCGIYIGNGNFIHASTTGYKVKISSLDGEYSGRFYSAIRLL